VALRLKRLGIQRVRPLAGGIEAWQARRLPLVPWVRDRPAPAGEPVGSA
jgi:hypothetical protein